MQETGLGVCFSGLYKTGMFYQSVQGRIHSGAERLTPTLHRLEQCTVYLRNYLRGSQVIQNHLFLSVDDVSGIMTLYLQL